MKTTYPNLHYFLEGYFHQDWKFSAADGEMVMEDFVRNESAEVVLKTLTDLHGLLSHPDIEIAQALQAPDVDASIPFNTLSCREWLAEAANQLSSALHEREGLVYPKPLLSQPWVPSLPAKAGGGTDEVRREHLAIFNQIVARQETRILELGFSLNKACIADSYRQYRRGDFAIVLFLEEFSDFSMSATLGYLLEKGNLKSKKIIPYPTNWLKDILDRDTFVGHGGSKLEGHEQRLTALLDFLKRHGHLVCRYPLPQPLRSHYLDYLALEYYRYDPLTRMRLT